MPIQYDKKAVLEMCADAMKNPALFYTQNLVNYQGICSDAQVPYTEIIAEFLIDHLPEFTDGITQIHRTASYCTPTHMGEFDPSSNRTEELTAMKMFNACKSGAQYAKVGKILDYQVPLKNKRSDQAGKIDLLAYDGNVLRVLELKKPDTQETMLRCVLEGYTYLRTADTRKLIADFDIPAGTPVKASPFVFENSLPYQEYFAERPKLKQLMGLLDSQPFFIREVSGGYEVFLFHEIKIPPCCRGGLLYCPQKEEHGGQINGRRNMAGNRCALRR